MRASDSGGDPRTARDKDFLIVIGIAINKQNSKGLKLSRDLSLYHLYTALDSLVIKDKTKFL